MNELFVELGVEELPASFLAPAADAFAAGIKKLLGDIPHGAIRTAWTPRRLAVSVVGVDAQRPMVEKLVTGPGVAQAFVDGQPGPIAISFAKARGIEPSQLQVVDTPKGKVIGFLKMEGGERTIDVLAAGLGAVILGLPMRKTMRWEAGSVRFGRPIRHLCAVFGGQRVETIVAGVVASHATHGHWLRAPERVEVDSLASYLTGLRQHFVMADPVERKNVLTQQLHLAASHVHAEVDLDAALLDEVNNLIEWPRVIVGHFDPALLELPPRLLVESMKKHQRYFPLYQDGKLSHHFLVAINNPQGDAAVIAAGNARVLGARFYDARFFYAEDRKKPLAAHGERLAGMTWIRNLGTMAERQASLSAAAGRVAAALGEAEATQAAAVAAGALCKSDLTTQMVGEFPELQGHVGRLLALADGASSEVAAAIEEHYLPRFAGDALPVTRAGLVLALADRLHALSRCFSIGIKPSASADPQGLRRAALGAVLLIQALGYAGAVDTLLEAADPSGAGVRAEVRDFLLGRLKARLLEEGHPTDLVEAVFATGDTCVIPLTAKVQALSARVQDGTFGPIKTAFKRAAGLVKEHRATEVDAGLFEKEAEGALLAALASIPAAGAEASAQVEALAALRPVVDTFFDAVLVMTDDLPRRSNRLSLLRSVVDRFASLADFTRLSLD